MSTGACIGHVSPEALAGGPIGKLRDGDLIEIVIDRQTLDGSINFVGDNGVNVGADAGARASSRQRAPRPDLRSDPALPDDTRIWAALQDVSGGTWGGASSTPTPSCRSSRPASGRSREIRRRDRGLLPGVQDRPAPHRGGV